MARGEELTDEQWAVIEPHLPERPAAINVLSAWRHGSAPLVASRAANY